MWRMLTRKMKDSGIEWIGEIPEDWEKVKFKYIFDYQKGKKPNLYNEPKEDLYPYVSMDVQRNNLNKYQYANSRDGVLGEKNDICVLWDGSNAGEFYRLRIKGVISSTSAIILRNTINPIVNKDYLFYFLKFYEIELKSSSIGMGIPHVDSFKMKNDVISFPSLKKQNIIVTELNSKTKKIGVLITEIKQSIEELKKYKQSLITEAVTKGLDPNVEMKDSGINWVERIPAHWNVNKGKYLFNKMDRPIEIEETVTAFRDGQVVQRKKRRTDGFTNSLKEIGYQGVKQGDLVIHSMDAFAGAIGISEDDGKCSPVCIVLDSENPNIYNPYFSYLMRVYSILGYIESMSKGIRVRSTDFKYNTFANTSLLFPSFVEQKEIVNYIEEETSLIDKLITDKTTVIEELENYKKSLIYEYVTGKKEV